jgi:iron complex outermembrane receptor protein
MSIRTFSRRPLARAACTLLALAASAAAQAQDQRIEITGSSIKRIDAEGALPVQVITRAEIEKSGVSTAAEMVKNLSANTAPLGDGASITDGTSGQRGFNGANLRGLGVSSTLILLNGRRLANFATPGDNAGVDLNNIPAGAIERIEVLKDGASAVYGSDAIGGVINFITRRDYRGADLGITVADTQHGGAGKKTATVSAGVGDLGRDRFNLLGVVDIQHLDALRSSQRDWIKERALATTLPALMSGNTYPANIDISSAQRNALIAGGLLPAGTTRTRINPSWATGCNPPATVIAPQGPGGPVACSYDYMQDTEIYPKSDKLGLLGRASFQLTPEHLLYAELMDAQAKTTYRLSPNPVSSIRNVPVAVLPTAYRNVLGAAGLPTTVSRIRWRLAEAGGRTNDVTSDGNRIVIGASGVLAGWDYDAAFSRAANKATDKYVGGYVLYDKLVAAVLNGTVNPFGASSQAGLDTLKSITVNDEARKSREVSQGIDFKASRALAKLEGGELALAVGGEVRREKQDFTPSSLLVSNNIQGDRDSSGLSTALAATRDSRNVVSLYTELVAPFTKTLEAQFALRHDRYNDAGNSTNPKLGLRWQPSKQLLVRGSVGTGFRAPSLYDLHGPTTYGTTSSLLTDPKCVALGLDTIDGCTDQWAVTRVSNPNLKPEKSRQFSLGTVFEPVREWSFSIDYWNIEKSDVISTLGEQIIIQSPDKYDGTYITRDADGFITNILLKKENQGRLRTSGVDLGADWKGTPGAAGRFTASVNGTLVLRYERQFGPLEPYRSNLGNFLNDQVIQRWRHRIALGWDMGAFGVTLANQYSAGYTDQNTAYDPSSNKLLPARKVAAYSLWDLTASWQVTKELKLRGGILNLLDTNPPFSNQAYYFLAGYDPTYTDPRGRSFYVGLQYSFR